MTVSYSCNELSSFPRLLLYLNFLLLKHKHNEKPSGYCKRWGDPSRSRWRLHKYQNPDMDLPFLFAQCCSQNGKMALLLPWDWLHVSLAYQAGPSSSPLSPNWNSLSQLLPGQAPVTSMRKDALPFSGWPHSSAAVLMEPALCSAHRGRNGTTIRLPTTVSQATGLPRVRSERELTVQVGCGRTQL